MAQATLRVCAAKADAGNTAATATTATTATTAGNTMLSDNEPRHCQSPTSPKFGHDRAAHCAEGRK